ncbi:MAG: hypothetical protein QMD86_01305 [Patescibacteria group bacterium]|nr:hypothetical protein [Patescibacteria group bacterium]
MPGADPSLVLKDSKKHQGKWVATWIPCGKAVALRGRAFADNYSELRQKIKNIGFDPRDFFMFFVPVLLPELKVVKDTKSCSILPCSSGYFAG